MPVLVTATQLRSVLGVSVSLYSDAALEEYIDAAEDAIGDFLTQHSVAIVAHKLESNVAYLYTDIPHKFFVGQDVTVNDLHGHGWNGTQTITEIPDSKTLTFAYVGTDEVKHDVIPNGRVTAVGSDLEYYDGVQAVEKAVIALAVEIFQAILTTGGTAQALDYTPSPYRLGRTLLYKVTGMISKYLDARGMVG